MSVIMNTFLCAKTSNPSFIIFIIKSIQYAQYGKRIMYLHSPITLLIETLLHGSY